MQRILLTGAAGEIGSVLRAGLRGRCAELRLSDRRPIADPAPGESLHPADLEDLAGLEAAMAGVDAVVHLGGKAQEGTWDEVLGANIVGTYNVFEAARRQGVRRVVFASSHHVIGYYERGRPIGPDAMPRPDSRYAVSKVFGEALGRLYADKYGLGVVCLRIGSFQEAPRNERMLSTWLSHPDTVALVRAALEAPDLHFEIVYGVSGNARSWWSDRAGALGYRPQDDAEAQAGTVLGALAEAARATGASGAAPEAASDAVDFSGASMDRDAVLKAVTANVADEPETARRFQGGPLCAMEFAGDLARVLADQPGGD